MSETILQFGGGRFLRAFVDRFVQHANDGGQEVGKVVVVQSTPGPRADWINGQPDGYHVLVRGYEDGELVDRVERVRSISRGLNASEQWDKVLNVARSPELRFTVSNATEAGYGVDPKDRANSHPPKSLPAKLTQVLWHRFQAGAPPVTLLPCELIERNADTLQKLVIDLASQWGLPDRFGNWVRQDCCWLNSLVDCIVINGPADHPLATTDKLLIQAEPYALWAVEKPKGRDAGLFRHATLHLVDDLAPYFLRKVRMLNGVHTAMVGKFLPAGFATVQQVLADRDGCRWVRDLLFEEIVPTLAYRLDGVAAFADQTFDRFRNPFLSHKLSDIALHHADKVCIRLEPTRQEYLRLFGKTPRRLAEAMAAKIS